MRLLIALCLALAAGPVAAQTTEAASPEQIAAARAEADRLIAEAGAGAWFENVTDGASPTVRHTRSGLTCRFALSARGAQIMIFPSPLPHGDDVGCNLSSEPVSRTIYATRYGAMGPTPERVLQDATTAIQQRRPDARRFDGNMVLASRDGATHTLGAAFSIGDEYTQVLVSHVGPWSIKERLTLTEPPSSEDQVWNALLWSMTLGNVVETQSD